MANKNIFKSASMSSNNPLADTRNLAGGLAYSLSDKHALAQFAVTGTFNNTFYADAMHQLENVKKLIDKVELDFIAKLAIYSRQSAFMKDMPAYLLAVLAAKDISLFKQTFPKVVDNGKMLRNFVQIVRSGVTGRKSLGTAPKRMIKEWIASRSDEQLFNDSVGNDPSLSDIIKMVHPHPETKSREAFYAYLIGRDHDKSLLPSIVKEFEAFKKALLSNTKVEGIKIPNVNFQKLTSLPLSTAEWESIARNAKWHTTRMNLNTFARHGVFKNQEIVNLIADRLKDEKTIKKSKVFPYQLFAAYINTKHSKDIPQKIINSLQDAMEIAIDNVPKIDGKIFVGVDISGSMKAHVSGYRGSASSKVTCRQVAALIASAIKRKNEETEVFVFDTKANEIKLNARDSVMTNVEKLSLPGGGTDCSSVLRHLNANSRSGDVVIIISDNESWVDKQYNLIYGSDATSTMKEWAKFKKLNPEAKLICIDLVPDKTVQAPDSKDRLNIGGFSDSVFSVISEFLSTNGSQEFWVKKIEEAISLSSNKIEEEEEN